MTTIDSRIATKEIELVPLDSRKAPTADKIRLGGEAKNSLETQFMHLSTAADQEVHRCLRIAAKATSRHDVTTPKSFCLSSHFMQIVRSRRAFDRHE